MSEITRAAIGMPFSMAMESELSRRQFHSIAQALLAERDRLSAEVSGLRTGYEAYEQVNAELKAEVEGLRDHLRLSVSAMPRDRLREIFNAAYYGPRELGSDGEQCRAGVLAVIGAALGQGEQP